MLSIARVRVCVYTRAMHARAREEKVCARYARALAFARSRSSLASSRRCASLACFAYASLAFIAEMR